MTHRQITSIALLALLALAGCPGGGGSQSNGIPPPVPTILAVQQSGAALLVEIQGQAAHTVFQIARSQDPTSGWKNVASIETGVYKDTDVVEGTTYYYRARALLNGLMSGWSKVVSGSLGVSLNGPTDLTATAVSDNEIDLTWTDNAIGEDGYVIERSWGDMPFVSLNKTPVAGTAFQDTGLPPGTTYSYRVHAVAGTQVSVLSNTATATTTGSPPSPPAAPTGLSATALSNGHVNLYWTDNATNETAYDVERSKSPAFGFTQIGQTGPRNVDADYVDTSTTWSTAYYYRVRAVNAGGASAYSNVVTVTTVSAPTNVPADPSNLVATAVSNTEIDLTFTDNATNEQGFKIERSTQASTGFAQVASVGSNNGSTVMFADTSLTASTTYYYRVEAYNAAGSSAYSNVANATTLASPANPPAAPTGVTAVAVSPTEIKVDWTPPSGTVTGYEVERSQSASSGFTSLGVVAIPELLDPTLTAGGTYYYKVSAVNAGGSSAFTSPVSATTPNVTSPPADPSNLVATAISTTSLVLTWTDNADNEDTYFASVSALVGAQPAVLPANTTSYTASNLSPGMTYTCSVQAKNAAGLSNKVTIQFTMPSTQPTTQTVDLYPAYDNLVMLCSMDSNCKKKVYATGYLSVGCDWSYGGGMYNQEFVCSSSALQFDTSALAGKTILQATVYLYPVILPADLNSTYELEAIATPWSTNSITWNTQPNIYPSTAVGQPPPVGSQPLVYDVTGIVQAWAAGAIPNDGLLLEDAAADFAFPNDSLLRTTSFYSTDAYDALPASRPTLEVIYQ